MNWTALPLVTFATRQSPKNHFIECAVFTNLEPIYALSHMDSLINDAYWKVILARV